MPSKKNILDFEKSLSDLNSLVEKMEKGNISLEDSLKAFENGVKLTRKCQTALQEAEQKVSMLIGDAEDDALIPFNNDEDEE